MQTVSIMQTISDKTSLLESARELGRQLRELPEYKAFHKAQEEFNQNKEVNKLVESYNALIPKLQQQQQAQGKPDDELMQQYRDLSHQLETHPEIHALMNAQTIWKKRLESVNEELSEKLDIEFGTMAKPEGGCC